MTDRVYPSAKTNPKPTFPATKSQLSGANRPTYRPQPPHRRSRGCASTFCCWFLLVLLFLLLLVGAAVSALYFLYRPQRPTFSVTSLKLSSFNLTSSTINAEFDLTLSTTNPNDKIVFSYDATSVSLLYSDTAVASATIPAFLHRQKNTTVLEATGEEVVDGDADTAMELKRSVKDKSEVALKVKLETKVAAQMSVIQTPPVGIMILCDGVTVSLPNGEKPVTASVENTKCLVDVRFKVWKWTLGI